MLPQVGSLRPTSTCAVRAIRDQTRIQMRFDEPRYYRVASSYEFFIPQIPSLIAVEKLVSHLVEAARYLPEIAFSSDVALFSISKAVDTVPLQGVHRTTVLVVIVQEL